MFHWHAPARRLQLVNKIMTQPGATPTLGGRGVDSLIDSVNSTPRAAAQTLACGRAQFIARLFCRSFVLLFLNVVVCAKYGPKY